MRSYINNSVSRGISISPVVSKVFEHCILDRYSRYFVSNESQFGFKKGSGCRDAIFSVRSVVDNFVKHNSTVNLCALDLTKAYDKMNHQGLFIRLMEKNIPCQILLIIENWFKNSSTCVRFGNLFSNFFTMQCGVRQGGVLSPYLFATYIDTVIERVKALNVGCKLKLANFSILVYADDILLISPTVTALQTLLTYCENELLAIDMHINPKKCFCIRFGPDYSIKPKCIQTIAGVDLSWVNEVRYLGMHFCSKRTFTCTIHSSKCSFYMAFNAIFGKIGGIASEETILHLLRVKCLPILLYSIEAISLKKQQMNSLQFAIQSCFSKIFKTKSNEILMNAMIILDSLKLMTSSNGGVKTFLKKN